MSGTVYARGERLYIGFKDANDRWTYSRTEYVVGEEAKARELLRRTQEAVARGDVAPAGPLTFERYFETWTADRKSWGIASAVDERVCLGLYALGTQNEDFASEQSRSRRAYAKHYRVSWARSEFTSSDAGC